MAIGGRRPLQGRKPGDRRVRVERPHSAYFRWSGPGQLVAKQAASAPTTAIGRAWAATRRVMIGRPLASEEEITERLPKKKALAIFSSDAISSSTYASEEILLILVTAGATAVTFSVPIAIGIAALLLIVSTSYRQICHAYPSGGGAYAVAKANINMPSALLAAAALLFDYMMTVAVSIAAGIAAITSVIPELIPLRVELALLAIALLTVANLRGLRESGNIFALPTYAFVGGALLMIGLGLISIASGDPAASFPAPDIQPPPGGFEVLTIVLLVRAFAFGSVALTGTEAISNGVPAFKPPEPTNAANTLTIMAVLLGTIFIGISLLAAAYGMVPSETETLISQVSRTVFGDGPVYIGFQAATALILLLAANTGYNGAPRLAQILAADGYLPRQFAFRGDRLAYSWGIIILAVTAGIFVAIFDGSVNGLIPLYSVGIFASFTLSQAGMVKHWFLEHGPGWRWKFGVNLLGAAVTGVVAVIIIGAKFSRGAWIVLIAVPLVALLMVAIRRQYRLQAAELAVADELEIPAPHREQRVIVPVPGITRAVVQAVNFGRSIATDVRAVYVTEDPDQGDELRERWERQFPDVPLVIVESPYRALVGPVVAYLDVLDMAWPPDKEAPTTIVVIPEYVAKRWYDRLLYNQSARRLRAALVGREHTVIADVPYRRRQ
ncbi:MAG TPA: APC family permease [Candidatus Limnocylindrales bacterium]|nr:APC family permease [Candidatus Limnocylindrales bacterium]